jgi:K+-transporting ATPase KdpF subunit
MLLLRPQNSLQNVKFYTVFTPADGFYAACLRAELAFAGTTRGLQCREASNGFRLSDCGCGIHFPRSGLGQRLFGTGAEKVNWAYGISGLIALALLVYLVGALIRAEDL